MEQTTCTEQQLQREKEGAGGGRARKGNQNRREGGRQAIGLVYAGGKIASTTKGF